MKKPTEAQIKEWKEKYGEVHQITVGDAVGYVRKPSRTQIDHATVASQNKRNKVQPMKFNEILLRDIWIDGDQRIITDDTYFMPAVDQLEELMEEKVAEIKKL